MILPFNLQRICEKGLRSRNTLQLSSLHLFTFYRPHCHHTSTYSSRSPQQTRVTCFLTTRCSFSPKTLFYSNFKSLSTPCSITRYHSRCWIYHYLLILRDSLGQSVRVQTLFPPLSIQLLPFHLRVHRVKSRSKRTCN